MLSENVSGVQVKVTFDSHRDKICQAIADEIRAIRSDSSRGHLLYDGTLLKRSDNRYLYLFRSEDELASPGGTPARLAIGDSTRDVEILACEGFDIYLSSRDESLGQEVSRATLSVDLSFLLEKLRERIEDKNYWNEPLLKSLFSIQPEWANLQFGQDQAVRASLKLPALFLWGPPGTGKTTTIGRLVTTHLKASRRVFVLSHTNVAVDAAILKVAELLKGQAILKKGKVLRPGVPFVKAVRENPYLSPIKMAERQKPKLAKERAALEKERSQLQERIQRLERSGRGKSREARDLHSDFLAVKRKLAAVYNALREAENDLIGSAQVVAATLCKAVMSAEKLKKADTVIVDEASMAFIPQVLFAAGLATTAIIVVGDFRQLPPISIADSKAARLWLHRDVFEAAKIVDQVDKREGDKRLVALKTQYRMHPRISGVCNHIAYRHMLHDAPGLVEQRAPILKTVRPALGEPLVLIDMSSSGHWALRTRQHSRYNGMSGALTAALAAQAHQDLGGEGEVGIITPYSAQARLIRRLLWDWGLDHQVCVATVHKFQGHERDVIFIDLTDAYPQRHPSKLLTGVRGSTAMRLLNVAASRARAKLIVIADLKFLIDRSSANSSLRQFLEYLKEKAVMLSIEGAVAEQSKLELLNLDQTAKKVMNCLDGAEPVRLALAEVNQTMERFAERAARSGAATWAIGEIEALKRRLGQYRTTIFRERNVPIEMLSVADRTWLMPLPQSGGRWVFSVRGERFASGIWAELGLDRRKTARDEKPQKETPKTERKLRSSWVCQKCGENLVLGWPKTRERLYWTCPHPKCSKETEAVDENLLTQLVEERGGKCPSCRRSVRVKEGKSGAQFAICSGYPKCQGLLSARDLTKIVEAGGRVTANPR